MEVWSVEAGDPKGWRWRGVPAAWCRAAEVPEDVHLHPSQTGTASTATEPLVLFLCGHFDFITKVAGKRLH